MKNTRPLQNVEGSRCGGLKRRGHKLALLPLKRLRSKRDPLGEARDEETDTTKITFLLSLSTVSPYLFLLRNQRPNDWTGPHLIGRVPFAVFMVVLIFTTSGFSSHCGANCKHLRETTALNIIDFRFLLTLQCLCTHRIRRNDAAEPITRLLPLPPLFQPRITCLAEEAVDKRKEAATLSLPIHAFSLLALTGQSLSFYSFSRLPLYLHKRDKERGRGEGAPSHSWNGGRVQTSHARTHMFGVPVRSKVYTYKSFFACFSSSLPLSAFRQRY